MDAMTQQDQPLARGGMIAGMKQVSRVILAGALVAACSSGPSSESPPSPEAPAEADPADPPTAPTEAKAKEGWKARLGEVDKLVYRFQDSSVPPQYHRSKTITVTTSEVRKVVDSYGDIISESANPIREEQFRSLLATLEPLGVEVAVVKTGSPGCTGGTSDGLRLFVGDDEILSGSMSSCGGETSGGIRGDLKKVASNAIALLLEDADVPSAAGSK